MKFLSLKESKYTWLIIIVLTIIAIIFKSVYRQHITENKISDFGIADTSPNFFAGLISMFMYFTQSIYDRNKFMKHSFFVLVGLIGYELVQGNILTYRTFDFRDISASIIGVLLGYILCIELNNKTTLFSKEKKPEPLT
jgi:surface polysaccharide O-acyltransferase-like enzyme